MKSINQQSLAYLESLNNRLSGMGFSWQHRDYIFLRGLLPDILSLINASQQAVQADANIVPTYNVEITCRKCGDKSTMGVKDRTA